jgi:hypothetical protein
MKFALNKKGTKKIKVSNYDTSLMLTLKDVLPNDRDYAKKVLIKKESAPAGKLRDLYHTQCNSSLVRKIFTYTLKLILWEVAAGNCSFSWPNNSGSKIFMGWLNDKAVKDKVAANRLNYMDLLQTDYKVPYVTMSFTKFLKKKDIKIYVTKDIYYASVAHANSGKEFSNRPRKINYFLPHVYEEFSYIEPASIRQLVSEAFTKVLWYLKQGEEIRVIDKTGEIRFFRPLGNMHDRIMTSVVKKRIQKEHNERYEKFFI